MPSRCKIICRKTLVDLFRPLYYRFHFGAWLVQLGGHSDSQKTRQTKNARNPLNNNPEMLNVDC